MINIPVGAATFAGQFLLNISLNKVTTSCVPPYELVGTLDATVEHAWCRLKSQNAISRALLITT